MQCNVHLIQKKLNITFNNPQLLIEAFTHSSFKHENPTICIDHNERLEFLGDSIFNMIVTEYLFFSFSKKSEGSLSKLRSLLVDYHSCSGYIDKLGLSHFLRLGKGEIKNYDRGKLSNQSNLFEALIGALFLDQGLEVTREFVLSLLPDLPTLSSLNTSHNKNRLQDYSQKKYNVHPVYELIKTEQIDNRQIFHMQVTIHDTIIGEGSGTSKKEAENQAALNALNRIENI